MEEILKAFTDDVERAAYIYESSLSELSDGYVSPECFSRAIEVLDYLRNDLQCKWKKQMLEQTNRFLG